MKIIKATTFVCLMLGSLAVQAGQPIINLRVGGEISPGVYGEVQFGNAPPPPVFYSQPRIIVRQPHEDRLEPLYLHVPPGHAKNWAKHCREYSACNRPVFFVRSEEYEPGYRERKSRKHKNDHGDEGDRRNEDRGDRGEHRGDRHRD